ncbi:ribosome biogenesis GTPase YlqF [Candidatus Obscuribacterales bacterium]|nr:ribosome biogenesis GTPase YlqF [Candidatus Obscuribacterales bacterium]MBX3148875.1 ribosome biogenesis GTPase YlqF [Candidatus Obscuribacterales bacterium]
MPPKRPNRRRPDNRPSASSKPSDSAGGNSDSSKNDKPAKKKPQKRKSGSASTPFQHITELIKWVDLVIEVMDARVPLSTRHPRADEIFGRKPRLFVFTKSDLCDVDETRRLIDELKVETGYPGVLVSLKTSTNKDKIVNACIDATKEKLDSLVKKGILPRPMRVCVVGLPNVGKSSLINWLIGQNRTRTGNKPGVTKGTQWVRVHPKLELLDTPGILPPTAFPKPVKDKLAICNLVPESNYDRLETAEQAILDLRGKYPGMLESYIEGLSADGKGLSDIAAARNLLTSGANPDINRAAALLLSELRDGRVGRFTLDP